MARKKRILVDLDETLNQLVKKWLSVYNDEFQDHLRRDEIPTWNILEHVKPEARDRFFDYLKEPGFFKDLDIQPNAQEVTKWLSEKYELFVVTAYCPEACLDKYRWVRKNFSHIHASNIVFCRTKGIIRADFMIDDGLHNIEDFVKTNPNGVPMIFDAPWNRNVGGKYVRAKDWAEVREWFFEFEHQL